MPPIDVVIETAISTSIRAQQLSSMFDVPAEDRARLEWHGEFPIETKPWHVGLIVGPSGAGKTTILRRTFAEPIDLTWGGASVIDDFRRLCRSTRSRRPAWRWGSTPSRPGFARMAC